MKKSFFITLLLALMVSVSAKAQPRAIGANLGYGVAFSYQHTLSQNNMLDLSVWIPGFAGIGVEGTYDWLNPFGATIPWNNKGHWEWEMGVGAAGGFYFGGYGYAGAAGHIGVAYNFWFPLQLSLDWRPTLGVVIGDHGDTDSAIGFYGAGLYGGITLGVRYLF